MSVKKLFDEAITSLKDIGTETNSLANAVDELFRDLETYKNDPIKIAKIKHALEVLIPSLRIFILAESEAKSGLRNQAIVSAGLNIAGRLLASAVKHFLI